jgi:hypothetical protein
VPQLTTGPLTADDEPRAARGGRAALISRWPALPYLVFGSLFWTAVAVTSWRTPIASDFGQHASAVQRVKDDWLHPDNPLLKESGAGSPYFSPYIVTLGLFAKLSGLAAWRVVKLCVPVNLTVLLWGVWAFTRTLSRRPWAPVYALAAFTLLWGVRGKEWSGFCGAWSLTHGAPYPSCFAVGLTLLLWAWTDRLAARGRQGGGWAAHAGLGLLGGVLLLIHPITALAGWVGMGCVVAARQRGWNRTVAARWAVVGAAALLVALVWPYYDVFALAGDTTVDGVHRRLYTHPWHWYGLAFAVGLPALVWRARRGARDPLVLMFAADCLLVGYGWVSGHYTYGRVFALLVVALQFAVAVELAAIPPWTRLRAVLAPVAAMALCLGAAAQIGAFVPQRYLPVTVQHPVTWPRYSWAAGHLKPGDVVVADGYYAPHVLPAYGAFLVTPTWPDPSTPAAERTRRWLDAKTYLDPRTAPDVRARIGRRYGIRWLLLRKGQHIPYNGRLVVASRATGERLVRLADG